MIYRWAAWLLAIGAACALPVLLDDTPADPRAHASPGAAHHGADPDRPPPARALLVYRVAGRSPELVWMCPQSHFELPPGLRLFLGEPEVAADLGRALELLPQGQERNLQTPVTVRTQLATRRPWRSDGERPERPGTIIHIWPAWDIVAAFPPASAEFSDRVSFSAWEFAEMCALMRTLGDVELGKAPFWASYRRGLAGPEDEPAIAPGELATRFYGTRPLHPLGDLDPAFDALLADQLQMGRLDVETSVVPGGLSVHGDAQQHAAVTERLWSPQFVALARTLRGGTPRRRALARRAALSDDNPWIAEFALVQLLADPGAAAEAPYLDLAQLVTTASRCDRAILSGWNATLARLLAGVPPQAAVEFLGRACQSHLPLPADPDDDRRDRNPRDLASVVLGQGLTHAVDEVRRVAMAAILRDLPPQALGELVELRAHTLTGGSTFSSTPIYTVTLAARTERWTLAEREAFFQALVERLREELQQQDHARAIQTLQEALRFCAVEYLPEVSPGRSRLRELAADLCLNRQRREAFAAGRHEIAVLVVAAELVRRSDPEARRIGCQLISNNSFVGDLMKPLKGDPFTKDIVQRFAEEGPWPHYKDGSLRPRYEERRFGGGAPP